MKALLAFWESVRITSCLFFPVVRCSAARTRLIPVAMLVISIGAFSETGLAQSSKPDVQIQVERQKPKKPFQLALSFPEPCEYPDETHSFPYSSVCGWEAEFAYQVGYSYEDGDIHTSFTAITGQTCDAWMTANANQDSKPIVEDLGSYFPFTPPWQRRGLYRGKEYKDFVGTRRLQIQAYGCLPLDGEIVIASSWGNIIAGSHAIARLMWMYKQAATAFTEQAKGLSVKVAEFRPTTPASQTAPLQTNVPAAAEPKTAADPAKPALAPSASAPVSKASVQPVTSTTSRTVMLPTLKIPIKLSAEASRWRLPEKDEGTGLRATLSNGEDLVVFFGLHADSGCAGFIDASIKSGAAQDPKNPPVALSKPSYLPDSWYGRIERDKSLTTDTACLATAQYVIDAGISVDWDALAKGPKPSVDEATALLRALLESVASSLNPGAPAKDVKVATQHPATNILLPVSGLYLHLPAGPIQWRATRSSVVQRAVDLIEPGDSDSDAASVTLLKVSGAGAGCSTLMSRVQAGSQLIQPPWIQGTNWYPIAEAGNGFLRLCRNNPDGVFNAVLTGDSSKYSELQPLIQSLDAGIETYYTDAAFDPTADTVLNLRNVDLNVRIPVTAGIWQEADSGSVSGLSYISPDPGAAHPSITLGFDTNYVGCESLSRNWSNNPSVSSVNVENLHIPYRFMFTSRDSAALFSCIGRTSVGGRAIIVSLLNPYAAPGPLKMALAAVMAAIKRVDEPGTGVGMQRLYDAAAAGKAGYTMVRRLNDIPTPLCSVAVSPNGAMIAAARPDGTVQLWKSTGGNAVSSLKPFASGNCDARFALDGDRLLVSGDSGAVKVLEITSTSELKVLHEFTVKSRGISYSADGDWLTSRTEDGRVISISTSDGQTLSIVNGGPSIRLGLVCPAAKCFTTTNGQSDQVQIWDAMSGKVIRAITVARPQEPSSKSKIAPSFNFREVAFSPDGKMLLVKIDRGAYYTYDPDQMVLFDVESGREVRRWSDDTKPDPFSGHSQFTSDGHSIFLATGSNDIAVWGVNTGSLTMSFFGQPIGRYSAAWGISADGGWLVRAMSPNSINVYKKIGSNAR